MSNCTLIYIYKTPIARVHLMPVQPLVLPTTRTNTALHLRLARRIMVLALSAAAIMILLMMIHTPKMDADSINSIYLIVLMLLYGLMIL
jgi:hypothetical protein